MTVFVVTMYRWGDRENHSYVLGVFTTKENAEKAGEAERQYRGGSKYFYECLEVALDSDDYENHVVAVEMGKPYWRE